MPRRYRVRVGKPRAGQPLTRPNVLLVMVDDQEYDTTDADVMPYLASQPHGSWVSLPRAVVASPLCAISRANMLTGQHWQTHGVVDNGAANLMDESITLATTVSAAGYRTGFYGKYQNGWPVDFGGVGYTPPGWDSFWARSQPPLEDYFNWAAYTNIPGAPTSGGTADVDYMTDVMRDLADTFIRDSDPAPWFCYVAPGSPHLPVQTPSRHDGLTFTPADPPDFNPADMSQHSAYMQALPLLTSSQAQSTRGRREGVRKALRSVDEMLEKLLTSLEVTGQLDNTVVVYCTDNSNMLGRKRVSDVNGHEKRLPYHSAASAQLHIRYPGATTRTDLAAANSLDISCSIASWAQGTWGHPVAGSTRLADWLLDLGGKRPAVEATYAGGGPPDWNMLLTDDGWKYVEWVVSGERELYDLNTDPDETVNLHGDDPTRDADLSARLAQHMADPLFWEA